MPDGGITAGMGQDQSGYPGLDRSNFGSGAKATRFLALMPKRPRVMSCHHLYRCQSNPIFGSGAKATQSDLPGFELMVATRLLPLIVALLVPSGLVENFKTMNPRGGSYLMIRELKGVESMSSRRLLI